MYSKMLDYCMILISAFWLIISALIEIALLAALNVSIANREFTLEIIFASCAIIFGVACFVSLRVLFCEIEEYKRNRAEKRERERWTALFKTV